MIIKDLETMGQIAEELRQKGKRIVTCNGAFDILHLGHVRFLQEAKAQGDVLVVGLNADDSIRRYKAEDRPINSQDARAEVLDALRPVDYVVVFEEETPLAFLRAVKPEVHCNGEEYGKDCVEAPVLKELGASLHLIGRIGDYSTTDMLRRLREGRKT
ncbi:MAG: adenylyltransferase/cytidyltransferase family protein [DPANN group archaeon]|nr:adenylyltransferase/cytidyltransferase family protein [DPANN group archaeon]